VGILVSQLPPAELARLKAELAETMVTQFCYPRFYDYRTDSLRMRPVDRAKRQEVWQYLNSVDFNAWGRIDLMSPDLQRQVERLFIHFVQRNRSFFGEQGRKRMADVRMLISTVSSSVEEGLRGHLVGHQTAFGSPRPVTSWAKSNVTNRPEPGWEQLAATTMLLQQQVQEARGEIKAAPISDARTNGAPAKRSIRSRLPVNGSSAVEPEATSDQHVAFNKPAPQGELRAYSTSPLQPPKVTNPLGSPAAPQVASVPALAAQPVRKIEQVVASENVSVLHSARSRLAEAPGVAPQVQRTATPPAVQQRDLPRVMQASVMGVATKEAESTTVLVSDEDVVIFEQMRHQLVVWLRIEAVRAGMTIAGQGPAELLELLRREDNIDETQLQVVSTLLNLSDQIITAGHASLLEYKQAMMFYLMHTRPTR